MVYEARFATKNDVNPLKQFLKNARISFEGVEELFDYFIILENDKEEMVASLGIEPLQQIGLLRSFVMMPSVSEEGLFLLFEKMMQLAQKKQVKRLLLATNRSSSIPFLAALGFQTVDRAEVPAELSLSSHGKQLLQKDGITFMDRVI